MKFILILRIIAFISKIVWTMLKNTKIEFLKKYAIPIAVTVTYLKPIRTLIVIVLMRKHDRKAQRR